METVGNIIISLFWMVAVGGMVFCLFHWIVNR